MLKNLVGQGQVLTPRPQHHCVVSGTGRAGTSFIIQLLSNLGKDTGFGANCHHLLENVAKAGLESDLRSQNAPYIVKSPWICDYIDEVLAAGRITIDHAFIPVRNLEAAARSRAHVQEKAPSNSDPVAGGLWYTDDPTRQADILAHQFYKLVSSLVRADIPTTFIAYPRLTHDVTYLYHKLAPLVADVDQDRFCAAFESVRRPEWVHVFSEADR